MNLTFSDEQEELRRSVRAFLASAAPVSQARRLIEDPSGYDPAVWRRLAGELDLVGIAIPEEYGGAGFGPVELGIVLEEAGRALLAAPLLSSAGFAASMLLAAGDAAAKADYLPAIAAGSTIATLGVAGPDGRYTTSGAAVAARADGGAWRLTGSVSLVPDGHIADLLLVIARTPGGPALFAVEGTKAAGVTRRRLSALDPTRPLARVDFEAAPARLAAAPDAGTALARGLDLGTIALAHEQVGGAARCLEMAVDYAKLREQFGRPIGTFQAIKHKCADVLVAVESARSAAYYAAAVAAEVGEGAGNLDEAAVAAALAARFCSEGYVLAAKENVQIHGGIGFTWEHDAHLYLKRAKSSQLLFGTPEEARDRLADLVGIGGGAST